MRNFKIPGLCLLLAFLFIFVPGFSFSQETIVTETVYFGNGPLFSISIDIPGSIRIRDSGTIAQGAYMLQLNPVSGEKLIMLVTILRNQSNEVPSRQNFNEMVNERAQSILPQAVENEASYHDVSVEGGFGRYFTLTDASLVNTTPAPDDYLFVTSYHAYYEKGYFIIATLLTDELDSENYKHMLNALLSIRIL